MRYVTFTRFYEASTLAPVSITVPYNGDAFEFLPAELRALARNAASQLEDADGKRRLRSDDGEFLAEVFA